MKEKRIPHINKPKSAVKMLIYDKLSQTIDGNISFSFSHFILDPVMIPNIFNNHFKNEEHLITVLTSFIGKILPKITSCKIQELLSSSLESNQLHFHTVDSDHKSIIAKVLCEYGYKQHQLEQMMEGNDIIMFAINLGHIYPARIVCQKIGNELFPLFFDTNHHIYMNEKYVKESFFYEHCPKYINNRCDFMPVDCFAFGYLDEEKLKDTYNYSYTFSKT